MSDEAEPSGPQSDAERAAIFYGDPTSQPSKGAEATPASSDTALSDGVDASAPAHDVALFDPDAHTKAVEAVAAAITENLPEPVKKLREGNSALFDGREAYSTAITIDDFAPMSDEASEASDIPEHVKAAAVQEYRAIFHDLGVAPDEAREVVGLARQLGREPPTAEAEAEWTREAAQQLVDTNGGSIEEANAALSLAKELVQRDPRLKTILEVTRLGSHPRVVKLLVQRARAERVAGRL